MGKIFPHDEPAWTDKEVGRLLALRAGGLTCDQCAKQMGKTKGAIVGKLRRIAMTASSDPSSVIEPTAEAKFAVAASTQPGAQLREAEIKLLGHLMRRMKSPLVIQEIDEALVAFAKIRAIAADLHEIRTPPPFVEANGDQKSG